MSTNDGLDAKSDSELSVLFAHEIVGFKWIGNPDSRTSHLVRPDFKYNAANWITSQSPTERFKKQVTSAVPDVCTDANAVLPWLEKLLSWRITGASGAGVGWIVEVDFTPVSENAAMHSLGRAPTFARAAVIALLRAKRSR